MINPDIKIRLESLTPDYAEFVKSNFAQEVAITLGKATQFDEDQTIVLNNGIMLYLLLFLDFTELVEFIETECEVTNRQAVPLAGAVLASLPDGFAQMHDTAYRTLGANVAGDTNYTEDLSVDIEKTEAALKAIPKFSPAGDDVPLPPKNDEVTYSSTQADILQKTKPVMPSNTPHWGNEEK